MSNSLKLQVLLSAVDKISTPLKSVATQANKMSEALLKTKANLKSLEQQQKLIDQFRQTKMAVFESNKAIQEAKNKAQALAQQLNATAQPTQKMQKAFDKARNAVKKLEAEQIKHNQKLRETRSALDSNGINTKRLSQAQQELSHKMKLANQEILTQENRLSKLNQKSKESALYAQRVQNLKDRSEQLGTLGQRAMVQSYVIGTQLVKPVAQFMEFEDAMAGVARQVQGLKDASGKFTPEYDLWKEKIQDLSKELPLTTTQIAEMITAAARMDVPKEQLEEFVRINTQMATAFDALNPDELVEQFGKVSKNFKLSAESSRELADAINYLDDNAISKGTEIIGFMNRVSGIAGIAKISEKNMAALGSTLQTAGAAEEQSATAVNAIFTRLASASKKKPVANALSNLGLNASKVEIGMVKDAQGTIMNLVDALKKMPEQKRLGLIADLVGTEHTKTLALLVSNTEEWKRQIALANSVEAKGSMTREFETRLTTLSAKWQIFKNQLFNTNSEIGNKLKETLVEAMSYIGGVLDVINSWIKANPELTVTIAKWTVGIIAAMGAFGLLTATLSLIYYPFGRFILLLDKLNGVWGIGKALLFGKTLDDGSTKAGLLVRAGGALAKVWNAMPAVFGSVLRYGKLLFSGLITGIRAVAIAFASNPIGLAITAIIGILALLYFNWEKVKNAIGTAWDWLKTKFADSWFVNAINGIIFAVNNWSVVVDTVTKSIGNKFESLKNTVMGLWNGITSSITNAFNKAMEFLGLETRINSVSDGVGKVASKIVPPEHAKQIENTANMANMMYDPNYDPSTNNVPNKPKWSGGYAGNGGKFEPKGIYHGGEYIMTKEATSRIGVANLNRLNYGGVAGMAALASTVALAQPMPVVKVDNRPLIAPTQIQRQAPPPVNQSVNITVNATAGQSAEDIARLVARELEKQQRNAQAKARSRYWDK
ncbi:phage tail tape measure protein [Glaesserella parasuis]|uniref:phage tail tape measure protein n=1 Tax=Glaesserella parasuis TaxID=738 RepID=UPI00272176EF|nr:phage tail tape measure protein [Glaesserella parasuis]MDP0090185.1 phage tail tape measure protein [Glaesserella parasuis]MDP0326757.1 phage tail tape measure protein [Glaesserella parasuis]